jgi:hypothetical protein
LGAGAWRLALHAGDLWALAWHVACFLAGRGSAGLIKDWNAEVRGPFYIGEIILKSESF